MGRRAAVIRAKIKIGTVAQNKDAEGNKNSEGVYASGVYSSDPNSENAKWAKATPALSLNMQIDNPEAFDHLIEGEEYYLDFIPARKTDE